MIGALCCFGLYLTSFDSGRRAPPELSSKVVASMAAKGMKPKARFW